MKKLEYGDTCYIVPQNIISNLINDLPVIYKRSIISSTQDAVGHHVRVNDLAKSDVFDMTDNNPYYNKDYYLFRSRDQAIGFVHGLWEEAKSRYEKLSWE